MEAIDPARVTLGTPQRGGRGLHVRRGVRYRKLRQYREGILPAPHRRRASAGRCLHLEGETGALRAGDCGGDGDRRRCHGAHGREDRTCFRLDDRLLSGTASSGANGVWNLDSDTQKARMFDGKLDSNCWYAAVRPIRGGTAAISSSRWTRPTTSTASAGIPTTRTPTPNVPISSTARTAPTGSA